MVTLPTLKVSEAYSARFDNLDEVSHPAIFFMPAFGDLLQTAIDRGLPLSQAEVEAKFGPQSWEW